MHQPETVKKEYEYLMPRMPEIEAQRWGFSKVIDAEGHIDVRFRAVADKIRKIDRWLYRWEYHRPRITVKTRDYN